MMVIEGLCSLDASNMNKIAVTCKVGPSTYRKHYLGGTDVTYFAEQVSDGAVSGYHNRIIFRPTTVVPSVEIQ